MAGLDVEWGPHSPRAGFAADRRLDGWQFTEIKEAGRWAADSSLRTYLDIVSAKNIAVQLRLKGKAAVLSWSEENWPSYFPEEVIRQAYVIRKWQTKARSK